MGRWKRRGPAYDPNPSLLASALRTMRGVRFVAPKTRKRALADPMADFIEGASWWLARSEKGVMRLQLEFRQGDIPGTLYERMGAMKELGRVGPLYLLAVQLVRTGTDFGDWDLDLTLTDAGIYVDEPYDGEL